MLLAIHLLRNFPASNLNRDDTGAPKTQFFGGTERGRISSQCLKYAWRRAWNELPVFQSHFDGLGVRTRDLPLTVCQLLRKQGIESDELLDAVRQNLAGFGRSDSKKDSKQKDEAAEAAKTRTNQILFYAPQEMQVIADAFAKLIHDGAGASAIRKMKPAELEGLLTKLKVLPLSADVALFGRMTTDASMRQVESAIQVAHALSTNELIPENDFFTAVDDLSTARQEAGSGMMGDLDYNSSCYYCYASINLDQFAENLAFGRKDGAKEQVRQLIPTILSTISLVNPGAKQNSFAANTPPSTVMVELLPNNLPVSYANAFLRPVQVKGDSDLATESENALLAFADKTVKRFPLLKGERFLCPLDEHEELMGKAHIYEDIEEMFRDIQKAI